jgi:hypothetical protein
MHNKLRLTFQIKKSVVSEHLQLIYNSQEVSGYHKRQKLKLIIVSNLQSSKMNNALFLVI